MGFSTYHSWNSANYLNFFVTPRESYLQFPFSKETSVWILVTFELWFSQYSIRTLPSRKYVRSIHRPKIRGYVFVYTPLNIFPKQNHEWIIPSKNKASSESTPLKMTANAKQRGNIWIFNPQGPKIRSKDNFLWRNSSDCRSVNFRRQSRPKSGEMNTKTHFMMQLFTFVFYLIRRFWTRLKSFSPPQLLLSHCTRHVTQY